MKIVIRHSYGTNDINELANKLMCNKKVYFAHLTSTEKYVLAIAPTELILEKNYIFTSEYNRWNFFIVNSKKEKIKVNQYFYEEFNTIFTDNLEECAKLYDILIKQKTQKRKELLEKRIKDAQKVYNNFVEIVKNSFINT